MGRGKLILITGGARSGKSSFAERVATAMGGRVIYIATAEAQDDEMRQRILLHQSRRPAHWRTIEAPCNVEDILLSGGANADVILIDCLILYCTNLFLADIENEQIINEVLTKVDRLVEIAYHSHAHVIIVTNEVGMGIVPDNKLARIFRDIAGLANQRVAAKADEVYLTVSGLPVELKSLTKELSIRNDGKNNSGDWST